MNQNLRQRSMQRRLPIETVNWLDHLYSINPYPDRFQVGRIAFHCNIQGSRVRNWFSNRRTRDWRRGNLCRQCRYFKSSLATEELHRTDPYSRPCVTMSIRQNVLEQIVNQQSTFTNASTSSTSNNVTNINLLPATSEFIPFHAPYTIRQHQSHNLNYYQHQIPPCQQLEEQRRTTPLQYSLLKQGNLSKENECPPLNNVQEIVVNEIGRSTVVPCAGRQTCPPVNFCPLGQSIPMMSNPWMPNQAAFTRQLSQQQNLECYEELPQVSPLFSPNQSYDENDSHVNYQTFYGISQANPNEVEFKFQTNF